MKPEFQGGILTGGAFLPRELNAVCVCDGASAAVQCPARRNCTKFQEFEHSRFLGAGGDVLVQGPDFCRDCSLQ